MRPAGGIAVSARGVAAGVPGDEVRVANSRCMNGFTSAGPTVTSSDGRSDKVMTVAPNVKLSAPDRRDLHTGCRAESLARSASRITLSSISAIGLSKRCFNDANRVALLPEARSSAD
jgi:hypothetical protein